MRSGKYLQKNLYNPDPSNQSFLVYEIGHHSFAPNEKMAHGCFPEERSTFLHNKKMYCIHYIISGEIPWLDGTILHPGDAFVHTPEDHNFIWLGNANNAPVEWAFIKAGGYSASHILSECGIPTQCKCFTHPFAYKIGNILKEYLYSDNSSCDIDFLLTGIFYQIMSYHKQTVHSSNIPVLPAFSESKQKNSYIQKAIEYIDNHYSDKILLTDVSEYLHLSPDYVSQLFDKAFGVSFQKYLIKYRISIAQALLSTTNYSVATIANMVGYSDPQHFSQIFKANSHYTPTVYRKLTIDSDK